MENRKFAVADSVAHREPPPEALMGTYSGFKYKICANINGLLFDFGVKPQLLDRHLTAGVVKCCKRSATVETSGPLVHNHRPLCSRRRS